MKHRGYTRYGDLLSRICCALFIALGSYTDGTKAAEWNFDPRLTVSETYTDNVRLGSGALGAGAGGFGGGSEEGDFITQINPGFQTTTVARRFNMNADYTMNNLIFAQNSNFNRIRHQYNANATTEIIKNFFFIDGAARRTQQNRNLIGPQAVDNTNVTGNRIDLESYSVSPYIRYRFMRLASTELRYTRGIIETNIQNGLRNSQRDSYQFNLNSGSAFKTLQWGLNYSNQIIHFTRSNRKITMERSAANLRYNLTSHFALTATGGYESNDFGSVSRPGISAPSWTVGFFWAPTQRTDINLSAGKRFFGDTYSAEANHRTRLTTWTARYKEEVTTFNQQAGGLGGFNAFNGLGELEGLGASNPLNNVNNGLFLQKRFNVSASLNGAKNTVTFNIFNLSRKSLSSLTDDFVGNDNVFSRNNKQTGGNVRWRYKFNPRVSAFVSASFVKLEFLSRNTSTKNMVYTANFTRNFLSNLTGMLEYRRIQRQGGSGQFSNVSANSFTASLRMNF